MNFIQVEKYLYSRIKDKIDIGYSAGFSLERVKYTLKLLGDPQEKIKIIHIAGTSGKGSTATFISKILTAHGFKTGLTLSPHIQDIRERVQINNELIDKNTFSENFTELFEIFNEVEQTHFGSLSYFEMIICLAYFSFWKAGVDYAVIETGLGGTYDATNCVSNPEKLCVITRIGFDHMKILGNTLEEIAKNKAGIIGEHQKVIFLSQDNVNPVLLDRINTVGARSTEVKLEDLVKIQKDNFDIKYKELSLKKVSIGNRPEYQIENYALAIATIYHLAQSDAWEVYENILVEIFEHFEFSGRFEIIETKGIKYILDGAHNEQKMHAFISSLKNKYPSKGFTFVLAFKADKDVASMVKQIVPQADKILLTQFSTADQDLAHKSFPSEQIKDILKSQNYEGEVRIIASIPNIISELENNSINIYSPVIVTGSLYLVSEFRDFLFNRLPR